MLGTRTALKIVKIVVTGLVSVMILGTIGLVATGESMHQFSGGLGFSSGIQPLDSGNFFSEQGILSVDASAGMIVSLNTENCRMQSTDFDTEILTWWRVWDSNANADGKLEPGELIDTGWMPVEQFIAIYSGSKIIIPADWSGEIRFQLRMERKGLGNPAGHYSCALGVKVDDGS